MAFFCGRKVDTAVFESFLGDALPNFRVVYGKHIITINLIPKGVIIVKYSYINVVGIHSYRLHLIVLLQELFFQTANKAFPKKI
jgi:hypothetical protein